MRKQDGRRGLCQFIIGVELFNHPFQLTDVVFDVVGNVFLHYIRNIQVQQFGFALDNGNPGFKIRWLNVGNQSPFKAGAQSLLQCFDLFWRSVGGQDNLLACLVKGIKGVEKFLLGALLAADKLDVIDQKDVCLAVFIVKFFGGFGTDGSNQFVGKLFTFYINDVGIGAVFFDFCGDGI